MLNWLSENPALVAVLSAIVTWLARPYFDSYLKKKGENRAVIEDLEKINRTLEEIKRDFVQQNAYLAEKGKAAATKEDLEEINRKIESIRTEYASAIELLRWQLSRRATIHRLQIEKEFEVYAKIWDSTVNLQYATAKLRPDFESIDPNESDESRWQRKLTEVRRAYNDLSEAIKRHRPFYPTHIHKQLKGVLHQARDEFIDCEISLNKETWHMPGKAYGRGRENVEALINKMDVLCDEIRNRLADDINTSEPEKIDKREETAHP